MIYTGIPYVMQSDRFEWDDAKATSNRAKHDVSFEEAARVFDDPLALIEIDDVPDDDGEEREILIGAAGGKLLVVVHTYRNGRARIISARKATAHERREYENG
jgi:uncharacterized DUF497 family protein